MRIKSKTKPNQSKAKRISYGAKPIGRETKRNEAFENRIRNQAMRNSYVTIRIEC